MAQWISLLVIQLLMSAPAYAKGECTANMAGQENFCSGKNKFTCQAHSSVCTWDDGKPIRVVIEEKPKEECTTQNGKEAHEGFCKGLDKATCKTHSSLCLWE